MAAAAAPAVAAPVDADVDDADVLVAVAVAADPDAFAGCVFVRPRMLEIHAAYDVVNAFAAVAEQAENAAGAVAGAEREAFRKRVYIKRGKLVIRMRIMRKTGSNLS